MAQEKILDVRMPVAGADRIAGWLRRLVSPQSCGEESLFHNAPASASRSKNPSAEKERRCG